MMNDMGYRAEAGYIRMEVFDLNSPEATDLGDPPRIPSDGFLISYYSAKRPFHILLDAGKKNHGRERIVPYLRSRGIDRLDWAIVTHPHQDHFGGLIDILGQKEIEIGQILYAPIDEEDIRKGGSTGSGALNYGNWREFAALLESYAGVCRKVTREDIGQKIPIDAEYDWEIVDVPLFKQPGQESFIDLNNLNLVLRMNFRGFTALFPGDCGVKQSETILQSPSGGRIDDVFFLKAAHHGGDQSLTPEFIRRCNAKIVLIPSNRFIVENKPAFAENGHLYGKNGAKVFRTDVFRRISLCTDGRSVCCTAETPHYKERVVFETGKL